MTSAVELARKILDTPDDYRSTSYEHQLAEAVLAAERHFEEIVRVSERSSPSAVEIAERALKEMRQG